MRRLALAMLLVACAWPARAGIIDDLKAEGVLVLYHDYRSRSFHDFSGNGNDGTPTDVHFSGNRGVRFPASTSVITVSDSPELQLTEGTLVVFGEFLSQEYNERIISKRDNGGTNYEMHLQVTPVPRLYLYDGTYGRFINANITGRKYIAINMKDGEACEAYVDGVSIGLFYNTSVISVDDAPLLIGHRYGNLYNLRSTLTAALIINRKLTASEHAELYAELSGMRWPSRGFFRDKDADSTDGRVQFATTWAAEESYSLTSGWIPNTPLKISSGTWSVITEQVDGKLSKVLRCDSAGIVYLDTSIVTGSPTEDAYGTWEWWLNKGASTVPNVIFASNSAGTAGYQIKLKADESVYLQKLASTDLAYSASSYVSASAWHRYRVTRRDTDGRFHVYVDGSLMTVAGGSNPVTNNDVTTAVVLALDLDAGDKVSLGALKGGNQLVKWRGVNAP